MLTEVAGKRLESTDRMKRTFVDRMADLRTNYVDDAGFRADVDRAIKGPNQPRATAVVMRELVGGLIRDNKAPITPNDAMDFFHAVVPVTYCDFILLDGRWRDQVDRLRARLARTAVSLPVATAFSGAAAVDALLQQLE
jgi:hypothetical protein